MHTCLQVGARAVGHPIHPSCCNSLPPAAGLEQLSALVADVKARLQDLPFPSPRMRSLSSHVRRPGAAERTRDGRQGAPAGAHRAADEAAGGDAGGAGARTRVYWVCLLLACGRRQEEMPGGAGARTRAHLVCCWAAALAAGADAGGAGGCCRVASCLSWSWLLEVPDARPPAALMLHPTCNSCLIALLFQAEMKASLAGWLAGAQSKRDHAAPSCATPVQMRFLCRRR